MDRYNNYHKHTHVSNIFTPDVNVKIEDYAKRAVELREKNIFTTEHGSGGDIYEARDICDKYSLNCKFGMEGYIVPDPLEKDNRNYHIILIPKTNVARKKLNKASSHANRDGYYYKPRLFLSDLTEKFDDDELFITSACMAGLVRDEDVVKQILIPLVEKFGKNVFLEVQNHNEEHQITINQRAISFAKEHGLDIIAANDSHYIYPEQAKERLEFLKGKGINYGKEDTFILDYPSIDAIYSRFEKQGVLTKPQIISAINNTLALDVCENIDINRNIKMPTIYGGKTEKEKIVILKDIVNKKFNKVMEEDGATSEERKKYAEECRKEMQVIEETSEIHTSDYFLLNDKLFDLAINKYGGILTRTGRGSCGAFILNKILGLTQIDRLRTTLPMYGERFMSTARLLENHALPDFDANVVEQEPFVKASKELLGEDGCFPMLAYGTMGESEAFRNVCRSAGEPYDEVNDVSKDIDAYRNDKKWGTYIEESQKYVGTIVSASVHPCAHLLMNCDIEEEVGVVKLGDFLCAMITSSEADSWKYLKNDYLIVSVWDIISRVFKSIGQPIMPVKKLLENIDEDTWKLFDDGITCTLNQVGEDWATALLRKYKPRSMEELAMFVGAIRPNFAPQRDDFIARKPHTTGSEALDKVLEPTGHRVIFQESLMAYFAFLGVSPAESIGLIKKISKKKIKPDDFANLEKSLRENWIKNTGSEDGFDKTWSDMQAQMAYGFNSPHGAATALDCLYGAYLKKNYPLHYYTVVFNIYGDDKEKTSKLTKELNYFGIKIKAGKFRSSRAEYSFDESTKTIYKGIGSIKYISADCADQLYSIRFMDFPTFTDLLVYLRENTTVDARQIKVLTTIGFFSEFGKNKKLLAIVDKFFERYKKTYVAKTKEARIAELKEFETSLPDEYLPLVQRIASDRELLGYVSFTQPELPKNFCYVLAIDAKFTPRATLYCIATGKSIECKVDKKIYGKRKFKADDVLYCKKFQKLPNWRKTENGFEQTGTYCDCLVDYDVVTAKFA